MTDNPRDVIRDQYMAAANNIEKLALTAIEQAREITYLRKCNKELVEALEKARDWFQQYADGHNAKRDTDKAQRNQDRADFCARASVDGTQ